MKSNPLITIPLCVLLCRYGWLAGAALWDCTNTLLALLLHKLEKK